jgi:hypothetical protein
MFRRRRLGLRLLMDWSQTGERGGGFLDAFTRREDDLELFCCQLRCWGEGRVQWKPGIVRWYQVIV